MPELNFTVSMRGETLFGNLKSLNAELIPESETDFYLNAADVEVRFQRAPDGRVVGLLWDRTTVHGGLPISPRRSRRQFRVSESPASEFVNERSSGRPKNDSLICWLSVRFLPGSPAFAFYRRRRQVDPTTSVPPASARRFLGPDDRTRTEIKPTLTLTTAKASNFTQDEDPAGSQARQVELERYVA